MTKKYSLKWTNHFEATVLAKNEEEARKKLQLGKIPEDDIEEISQFEPEIIVEEMED